MIYKGWVPNALGRLSFSLLNDEASLDCVNTIVGSSDGKLYLASSNRYLSDDIWPESISRVRYTQKNLVADFSFILIGESLSPEHHYINGKCLVFLDRKVHDLVSIKIREVNIWLSDLNASYKQRKDVERNVDYICWIADKYSRNGGLYGSLKFKLDRDGTLDLDVQEQIEGADQDSLVQQSYFFIKDLFHKHKFHSQDTDALIFCMPCHHRRDYAWCDHTLFDLCRFCVRRNRLGIDSENYHKVLGIFAYINTFSNIYKEKSKEHYSKNHRIAFYQESMQNILNAEFEKNRQDKEKKQNTLRFLSTISLSFLATIILTVSVIAFSYSERLKKEILINDNVLSRIKNLLEHPDIWILFLLTIISVLFIIEISPYKSKRINKRKSSIQYCLRRIQMTSPLSSMLFLLVSAVLIFLIVNVAF